VLGRIIIQLWSSDNFAVTYQPKNTRSAAMRRVHRAITQVGGALGQVLGHLGNGAGSVLAGPLEKRH
jgi:hypothetical protein